MPRSITAHLERLSLARTWFNADGQAMLRIEARKAAAHQAREYVGFEPMPMPTPYGSFLVEELDV
jgi:hypothetical protein